MKQRQWNYDGSRIRASWKTVLRLDIGVENEKAAVPAIDFLEDRLRRDSCHVSLAIYIEFAETFVRQHNYGFSRQAAGAKGCNAAQQPTAVKNNDVVFTDVAYKPGNEVETYSPSHGASPTTPRSLKK